MVLTQLQLLASSPDAAYTSSVTAICAFANWTVSQTLPDNQGYSGYDSAAAVFTQLKNGALPWFNQVYPACISIATQVTNADSTITPQLNLLTSLATQLQSQPSSQALAQQISNAAQALATSVSQLATAIQAVQTAVTTSQATAGNDLNALSPAISQIGNDLQSLQQQLGQLYGQLHSLQNATCPSQSNINNCESLIQSTQNVIGTAQELAQVFNQAGNLGSPAIQGLGYIGHYWAGCVTTAQGVGTMLQAVVTAPVAVLKIDLATAQQGWNQTVAAAEATVSQLSRTNLTGAAVSTAAYTATA